MDNTPQEKPPLFSRWTAWYLVVAGWLAALTIFFYLFTKHYS